MIILGAVVAVLVLGAGLAWLVARTDVPGVPPAVTTESAVPLPAGPVGPDQVRDLRFDQAVRGYRMAQVDEALRRLGQELAARDAEIARLRDQAGVPRATEARHAHADLLGGMDG
ncbi:DivIVA domain-containing protein [Ornithinimicrobium kibberense]|uniref:DivIVA domain-containing protein n=1 Tax=Ornithinimicrobium kibberense TaxID=282060 RepID=A0ABV5V0B0_9MICO|nr:DivIVA domain-containing protein [Ornithinimicrobium kibberense]